MRGRGYFLRPARRAVRPGHSPAGCGTSRPSEMRVCSCETLASRAVRHVTLLFHGGPVAFTGSFFGTGPFGKLGGFWGDVSIRCAVCLVPAAGRSGECGFVRGHRPGWAQSPSTADPCPCPETAAPPGPAVSGHGLGAHRAHGTGPRVTCPGFQSISRLGVSWWTSGLVLRTKGAPGGWRRRWEGPR